MIHEFTFRFYSQEKHVHTTTFHTKTEEEANKQADKLLMVRKNWDDWELIKPKTNTTVKQ